jgi:hypothetical protein
VIGNFFFATEVVEGCICVEMRWKDSEREGVLHIPPRAAEQLRLSGLQQFETGSAYRFTMAMGIGVGLGLLTTTPLYLIGDVSVWEKQWGRLEHRDPRGITH